MVQQDLKILSKEEKSKIVEQINTELSSIAQEEVKTGQKIVMPDAERLVSLAGMSLIKCKKRARDLMIGMSKREVVRAVTAFLDLPQDGLPVYLKSDNEKLLFATGQRAISDRFIIIQHHINEQIMAERLKKAQEAEVSKLTEEGKVTDEQV